MKIKRKITSVYTISLLLLLLVTILSSKKSIAQFTIQTNKTPQQLVEEVLLGEGISVSNITYTGSALSIGKFTNTVSPTLNLDSGIILSTGRVIDIASANTIPNMQYSTFSGTDNTLQSLLPTSPIFDATVLEFDFIAISDSIEFQFALGSEEYSEWLGSAYNDVFGFFVTGANPNGGNYTDYNVALIPGTTTAVSTNTINNGVNNIGPCVNCNYYINNTNGTEIQFDGLTAVITGKLMIIPCQTYHIKIAIADGGDHSYDSGIFLSASSFSSMGIKTNLSIYSNVFSGNTISEGCDSAAIDFKLPYTPTTDTLISIYKSGSAIEGVDYNTLPNDILFEAGIDSVRIYIHPITDNISESSETISIYTPLSICANDTINIIIKDYQTLHSDITINSSYCQGQQINLIPNNTNGLAPYYSEWNSGNSNSNYEFTAQNDTMITYSITDACGNTDTVIKNIIVKNNPIIALQVSNTNLCFGDSAYGLTTQDSTLSFNWYVNNTIQSQHTNIFNNRVDSNYVLKLRATNSFNCSTIKTKTINVRPKLTISATPTLSSICDGDISSFTLNGAASYSWANATDILYQSSLGDSIYMTPSTNKTLTILATDNASCTDSLSVQILVNPAPTVTISASDSTVCLGKSISLYASGGLSYEWTPTATLSQNNNSITIASPLSNTTYKVKATNLQGCSSSDSVLITVYEHNTLSAIISNPHLCLGDSTEIVASGANHYLWLANGNNFASNTNSVVFYPSENTEIAIIGIDNYGCRDTISTILNLFPDFNFITHDTVCIGTNTQISTISTLPNLTYQWSNAAAQYGTINISSPTTITVTATETSSGCSVTKSKTIYTYPTIPINVLPNITNACENDTILLHSSILSNNIISYIWPSDIVWKSVSHDSVKIVASTSNSYSLSIIDNHNCKYNSLNEAIIHVTPIPDLTITPNNPIVQINSLFNLSTSGATLYNWTPIQNIIGSNTTASVNLFTDSILQVIVYGIVNNNCKNSDTIIVTPSPLFNISYSNSSICIGDSSLLTVNSNTDLNYLWSTGETTPSIWVKPTQTISYFVTVTDTNGFSNTKSRLITVYNKPLLNTTTDSIYACSGSSTKISVFGASEYRWYPSLNLTDTIGATVYTTTQQNTTYYVIGEDDYGCIDTLAIDVIAVAGASISTSLKDTTVCSGISVDLSVSGTTSYKWEPGLYLNDSLINNVTSTPINDISYTVIGTDNHNCKDSIKITINTLAAPVLTINKDTSNICIGDSIELIVDGAQTYSWSPSTGLNNINSTNIIANPQNTTNYTIVGTDPNGCTDTIQALITVNTYPNISITPSSNHICPDDSVVIQASGDAYSYNWLTESIYGTTTGSSQIYIPDTTKTYSVVATSKFNCVDTAFVTIYVEPLISIGVSSYNICVGDTAKLVANSNTNNVAFNWSNGMNSDSILITPTNTNDYYITATSTISGCSSTDSVKINVHAKPVVTLSTSIDTICPGNQALLTANGAITYNWTPNTFISNTYGNNVLVYPNNTTLYSVIGTNFYGCTDTTDILINTYSAPTVSVSPNFSSICSGESQLLTAYGGLSYSWSPNIGISSNFGDSIIVYPNTNMNYMVVGYDTNNCTDTAFAYFSTNTNAIITPTDPQVCYGDSLILDATSLNTPNIYQWSTGDTTETITISPTTNTSYQVTLTYNSGCSKVSSTNVVVHKDTSVSVSTPSTQICFSFPANLYGYNASSYAWSGPGISQSSNDSIMTIQPPYDAWYYVEGTSINGCLSKDSIYISLYSQPQVSISTNNNTVCQGDSTTLFASGAIKYYWPSTTSILDSLLVSPDSTFTYSVVGYDVNQCSDTAYLQIIIQNFPTINISPLWSIICPDDTTIVDVISNGTITWGSNNSSYFNNINNTQTQLFPNESLMYEISSITSNGCKKDTFVRCHVKRNAYIQLNSDTSTICLGDSALLTIQGALSLSWSPQPSQSNQDMDSVYVKPDTNTTYIISGLSSDGCFSSVVAKVNIAADPIISITSSNAIICQNDSVLLTATANMPDISWLWNTGDTSSTILYHATDFAPVSVLGKSKINCIDTGFINLNVNSNPDYSFINPSVIQCSGDSTLLIPTLSGAIPSIFNGIYKSVIKDTTLSFTYTDSLGCHDTALVSIDVVNNPTVDIVSNDSNICNGDTAILQAITSSSNLYTIWNNNQITSSINVSPNTNTIFSVTVIDSNNCIAVDSNMIYVSQSPQFSILPENPHICIGDTINLFTNLSPANKQSIIWSNGDTISNTTVNPIVSTIYSLQIIDSNLCSNTIQTELIVNPLPDITINVLNNNSCEGDVSNISASSVPQAFNYLWNNGLASSSFNYTLDSNISFIVTITDIHSCINTDTVDFEVNSKPQITVISSDSIICSQDTIQLSFISNSNYTNILWSDSQTTITINSTPLNPTYIWATITDTNNCSNSDSVYINVHHRPSSEIIATNPICENDSSIIHYSGDASNSSEYFWSFENTNSLIGNEAGPYVANWSQAGSYKVTLTVKDGICYSFPDSTNIIVNEIPIVEFTNTTLLNCDSSAVEFTCNNDNSTYLWNFGDPLYYNSSSNAQNPNYTYNAPGSYSVSLSVTNNFGCTSTLVKNSLITVYPKPNAAMNVSEHTPDANDADIKFYNKSTNYTSLQWDFGDPNSGIYNTSTEEYTFHIYQLEGVYRPKLIVKNEHECTDTAFSKVQLISAPTLYAPKAFTPNGDGLNDRFITKYTDSEILEYKIIVFNRLGQKVFVNNDITDGWDGRNYITGDECPTSVYTYKVYLKDEGEVKRYYSGSITIVK